MEVLFVHVIGIILFIPLMGVNVHCRRILGKNPAAHDPGFVNLQMLCCAFSPH